MARQGVPGMWFRKSEAQTLLNGVRLSTDELTLQIQKYSDLDKKRAEEVEALKGSVTLHQKANDALKVEVEKAIKTADAATADAVAAREELGRWWRSPIVWLSVGALAGALVGIAIAH